MIEALKDRIERLEEAIRSQNRTLAFMLGNQKLHNEMLAKVLEAVTKPADGNLGEVLSQMARQLTEIRQGVDSIWGRVSTE